MAGIVSEAPGLQPNITYEKNEKYMILIAACLGWGLELFDLQLLSLYAVGIMDTLQISSATFGAIAFVQLLATALGGVFFGFLADKYGRKRVLSWTILLFSIATFLGIFVTNVQQLFVLRFLTGLGTGGEWAVGFALLNEAWNPTRRGLMSGFVQATSWIGYAMAIFVNQLVPDWHWGFAVGGIPALAAVWVRVKCPESKVWLYYRDLRAKGELPEELQKKSKRSTMVQIFQRDVIRYTILGVFVVFGGTYAYYALSQWLPTILTKEFHVDATMKSNILYLGAAIAFVSYIMYGSLSDRFGRRRVFLIGAFMTLIAYVGFSLAGLYKSELSIIIFWYALFNIGVGYYGIFGAWFAELFPTRIRATGSSFCYNVARGLASQAPLIVGIFAAANNIMLGISTGVVAIVIMLVAIPFMVDRKGRAISSIE